MDETGLVLAISEERLSRKKHDHQIDLSLKLATQVAERRKQDIVRGVYSTCSDSASSDKDLAVSFGRIDKIPSHHYSHALSTFLGSPYDESLVIVSDAGGNTLITTDSATWWGCPREQTTVWYGTQGNVHLLERHQDAAFDIGFGEWYRAFTYFLGWPSHTLSGNTMALSASGDRTDLPEGIWDSDFSGTLGRSIQNDPRRPIEMVLSLLQRVGLDDIEPRGRDERLTAGHARVAAYIQHSLESQFDHFADGLISKYEQQNICLSGGVAQNCVMTARLAQRIGIGHIFVSAYSSDIGQCVGNALFGRMLDLGPGAPRLRERVFLGPMHESGSIAAALQQFRIVAQPLESALVTKEVAERVAAGQIVAIFRGRSEFGARALGHRSVICDPLNEDVVLRVKSGVKRRDEFMPLAPVVGRSMLSKLGGVPTSSTMTFAPELPEHLRAEFGHSVHIDGTARIQVAASGFLSDLLVEFEAITGRNVLINTSFNRRGEPMVESPYDALLAIQELAIDCLVLEDRIVPKELFD